MKINLLTDAPKHNLALMKISAWHKARGDDVHLNGVGIFDKTYGSWLFDFSQKGIADEEGGTGHVPLRMRDGTPTGACFKRQNKEQEETKPDYGLYGLDFSLGYTWEYCPRSCSFCNVPLMDTNRNHISIWDFHDSSFSKICLMNNNTFSDPQWRETFEEIWDANLTVKDENGYDLRLIQEEQADALKKTRFSGQIHYAWDLMEDETNVVRGLKLAPRGMVYVLIGFNTTQEEDFHRCQVIHDHKHDPYIMPYNRTKGERKFQRFINTRMYRKYKTLKDAWKDYR